jgi:hypothetical protein
MAPWKVSPLGSSRETETEEGMNARSKILFGTLSLILAALAIPACNKHTQPSPVPVSVTVREFTVTLDRSSAPRGIVIFSVHNTGTVPHEFLVIKTDRAPNALPTEDNGSYLEDGPGTQLLEEIGEIAPGETKELSIDLGPGNHVLICNMVHVEEDGSEHSHYAMGMHTAFRVE